MYRNTNTFMRVPTIIFIVALALFYNAESLFPDALNRFPYHFMYLFGTVASVLVVLVSAFTRLPTHLVLLFSVLAYSLMAPQFNGGYTLQNIFSGITLVEAALASGIVTLTHWYMKQIRNAVQDDQQDIDYSALPPDLEDEINEIKYEITRARRYNRPISVIMLEPRGKILGKDDKKAFSNILNESFRRTERLYDMSKEGKYLIFCPETTHSAAEMLLNRIRILTHRQQNIHFSYGIATFPDQELTFEGLLLSAREKLGSASSRKASTVKAIKDSRLFANR